MKGKDLQKIIKNSGLKMSDIVELSGIKKRTLSSLYDKDEVEAHYLDKLKKAGIKLQLIADVGEKEPLHSGSNESYMLIIESQKEIIEFWKNRCKELENPIKINHEKRKAVKGK